MMIRGSQGRQLGSQESCVLVDSLLTNSVVSDESFDLDRPSQSGIANRVSSKNSEPAPKIDSDSKMVPLPLGQCYSYNSTQYLVVE